MKNETGGDLYLCRSCIVGTTNEMVPVCEACVKWFDERVKAATERDPVPELDLIERYRCGCIRWSSWKRCEDHHGLEDDEEPPMVHAQPWVPEWAVGLDSREPPNVVLIIGHQKFHVASGSSPEKMVGMLREALGRIVGVDP